MAHAALSLDGWEFLSGALRSTSVRMIDLLAIRQRWEADGSKRDERGRRLFAPSEARAAGRGWSGVGGERASGLARSAIGRGPKTSMRRPLLPAGSPRTRRVGGGPRSLTETDAALLDSQASRRAGDPGRSGPPAALGDEEPDELASALIAMGHSISPNSVRKLLTEISFSRQGQPEIRRGRQPPRPHCQFE
jgi:hypothetical protein